MSVRRGVGDVRVPEKGWPRFTGTDLTGKSVDVPVIRMYGETAVFETPLTIASHAARRKATFAHCGGEKEREKGETAR